MNTQIIYEGVGKLASGVRSWRTDPQLPFGRAQTA
jgi:hypothetical protein